MATLPLYDLIELDSIEANKTYTKDNGGIIGSVDDALYGPDDDNEDGTIEELNESTRNKHFLTIDGVTYRIKLAQPEKNSPTTIADGKGVTSDLYAVSTKSDIAFIIATPEGGGEPRYFAVLDDSIGDKNVASIETRDIDFKPPGKDVKINVTGNNKGGVTCFAAGTLIETADGQRPIEEIKPGDLVMTVDHGLQAVAWMGGKTLSAKDLAAKPGLCPIRIAAGALAEGVPNVDLVVSPQHRILLRSNMAQPMFGTEEVLVAAKQLVLVDGIDVVEDLDEVTYYHMLFSGHEIVRSNGAETESLYTGPEALKSVGPAARDEIFALFPELKDEDFVPEAARLLAPNRMARKLAMHHIYQKQPLVS